MTAAKPRPLWRSLLAVGLKFAIGTLLLWLLARRVPLGAAFAELGRVRAGLWLLGVGMSGAVLVVGAWRWHLTALRSIPMKTCLAYSWIGHFYSTVLPGAVVGDVAKTAALATSDVKHRNMVLPVSVVLDRLLGLVSLLLILVLALVAMGGEKSSLHPALVVAGTAVIVAGIIVTPQLISAALSLGRRLHFLPHAVIHALDRINFVVRQVGMTDWLFMLVLSLLMHGFSGVVFVVAAREFGVDAESWRLALCYVATCVVIILPVTIAGIGAREQVSLWILGGVAGTATMPVALSWFLLVAGAVHAVIGGLVQLAGWMKSAKKAP